MLSVLLGVHFVLALAIIGLVLLQKHDSDGALGSSGGGAASGMFSVRGQANLLTRSTAWLMAFFMVNCLVMAKITKNTPSAKKSVIDRVAEGSVIPVKESKGWKEGDPMPTPPSDLSKLKNPGEDKPASGASKSEKPAQGKSKPAKPATPAKPAQKNPSKK